MLVMAWWDPNNLIESVKLLISMCRLGLGYLASLRDSVLCITDFGSGGEGHSFFRKRMGF